MAVDEVVGLRHARKIEQGMVGTNKLVSATQVILAAMVLPLALGAAYMKVLPVLGLYGLVAFLLALFLAGGPMESSTMIQALMIPSLEEANAESLKAVRAELLKGMHGRVLNLAPGSAFGLFRNFYAPKNKVKEVTTCEANSLLTEGAVRRAAYLKRAHGIHTTVYKDMSADDMADKLIEQKETFDVVVSYGFLDRSRDVQVALDKIDKLVRPGGTVIFMEHGCYENAMLRTLQTWANTIYRLATAGFNCSYDTMSAIKARKGWTATLFSLEASVPFPADSLVVGYAHKISKAD